MPRTDFDYYTGCVYRTAWQLPWRCSECSILALAKTLPAHPPQIGKIVKLILSWETKIFSNQRPNNGDGCLVHWAIVNKIDYVPIVDSANPPGKLTLQGIWGCVNTESVQGTAPKPEYRTWNKILHVLLSFISSQPNGHSLANESCHGL